MCSINTTNHLGKTKLVFFDISSVKLFFVLGNFMKGGPSTFTIALQTFVLSVTDYKVVHQRHCLSLSGNLGILNNKESWPVFCGTLMCHCGKTFDLVDYEASAFLLKT